MTFRLWGRPSSSRTRKVTMALAELGIDFEYILAGATTGPDGPVSKGGKPYGVVDTPEYLEMNPNGTVPTIDDNGYVLWESNAIVQYLGIKYNAALFYCDDTKIFASASRWMMWDNNQLLTPMRNLRNHLYRLPKAERDPEIAERAQQELIKELSKVERQLGKTEYLAADRWTMADIPMAIRCHRWHLFDIERPEMPNFERYYEAVKVRPSFEATIDPALHANG
jgi:glutathione S-transferase